MAGNQHIDEVRLPRELGEDLGSEMGTAIRNQKLQVGWQQCVERLHDEFSCDLGADYEEREPETLAGAIICDDQYGNPSGHARCLGQPFAQPVPCRPPGRILTLLPPQGQPPLEAQHPPVQDTGLVRHYHGGTTASRRRRRRWCSPVLLPDGAPGRILLAALLPDGATLIAQGGCVVPPGLLSRLRWECIAWGGWSVRRQRGRSAGGGDERLHRLGVGRLRGGEDLPTIGWFRAVVPWAFHHQAA